MSEYRVGELVDITIKGARVVGVLSGNVLHYTTQAGGEPIEHTLHIGKGWPGHIVERVAPAEWPPERGDIWEDRDGARWFAAELPDGDTWMYGDMARTTSADHLFIHNAPLTLVYRRESDGDRS